MIIQTEQLYRWMDDHNIHAVTREQLDRFAHEPNKEGDFGRGVIYALKSLNLLVNERINMWETTPLLACATCKYLQPDIEVCCCESSEKYTKFVDRMMSCEKWEHEEWENE